MDLRLLIALGASAVMFASIAFVFAMVLLSLLTGQSLDFSGGSIEGSAMMIRALA